MNKFDPKNTYASLAHFGDQCEQAWSETRKLQITKKKITNVVIAGMGGSALGPEIVASVFADRLTVPVTIVRDYALPAFVGPQTLVILSSYSGTTEETLAALKDAVRRKAVVVGITVGGPLAAEFRRLRAPAYVFDPKFNPGNQPRLGTGYSIFGIAGLLVRAGVLKLSDAEVRAAIAPVRKNATENVAKKLAATLTNRLPLFFASEHLSGAARTMQNRTHESAKQLAFYQILSEANHHLMEGLTFPRDLIRRVTGVFFTSKLYHARVQKRYPITMDVVKKNNARAVRVAVTGPSKLAEALWLVAFGGYLSFHLAMRNGVNPAPTPWVDYFKKRLSSSR